MLGDDVVLEDLPNLVKSVVNIGNHKTMSITNYAKRVRDFMGLLYNVVSIELYMDTLQVRASYVFHVLTLSLMKLPNTT